MGLVEQGTVGEFPYAIWKHDLGHLCGYVGVPASHPWNGEHDVWSDTLNAVDVHGGITYAGDGTRAYPVKPIPGVAWWVGFDCAHHGDLSPGLGIGGEYRDRDYVFAEIERLVQQAAEAVGED